MRRLYEIFFFLVPLVVVVLFVMLLQFEQEMSASFVRTLQITLGILTVISVIIYGFLVRERVRQIMPETKAVTQKELLLAIDKADVGYAIMNPAGEIQYVSSSAQKLLAPRKGANLIGKVWYTIDGDTTRMNETRKQLWEDFIKSRSSWQGIVRWLTGKGEKHYYDCTVNFIENDNVILVITDRTERVNAVREIASRERVHNYILDNIPMSITLQNINGVIEYSNDFLPNRLGITAEDLVGKNPYDLPAAIPLKELADMLQEVVSTEKPIEGRSISVNRGTLKGTYWLIFLYPVFNRQGQLAQILAASFERTERVRLSKERELFARKLFETQKIEAMNKFAGGLAHELSNLLHPAGVYARALSENPTHADREKLLTRINEAVLKSGEILRNTLAMSKSQIGEPQPLNLTDILTQIIDTAQDVAPKGLAYQFSPPGQEIIARVDDTELRQVILNLLVNAADAQGGQGVINIALGTETELPEGFDAMPTSTGPFACIHVTDHGVGMDEATREKIFEPFFTTKTKEKGTGLGLPVVQGIVTGWGGGVAVDSEPGKGSTFKLLLPLVSPNGGGKGRET
jgi:signal transduction histidine kinase